MTATRKHTQVVPAKPFAHQSDAPTTLALALDALREIVEERDRIYAVAVAGEKVSDDGIERQLFSVIETTLQTTDLFNAVRQYIVALGSHAGVATEEAAHG